MQEAENTAGAVDPLTPDDCYLRAPMSNWLTRGLGCPGLLAILPKEEDNLAESDPDRARELLARTNAYYQEQASELGLEAILREGTQRHLLKKLKALGYIE